MQKIWAWEVGNLKKTLKTDYSEFPNYFLKEKSDYCAMMMSALGIKELKRKSDMRDPHVSDWVHGGPSPPSRLDLNLAWVARLRTRGADAAPHRTTRTHGAEVAANVDADTGCHVSSTAAEAREPTAR